MYDQKTVIEPGDKVVHGFLLLTASVLLTLLFLDSGIVTLWAALAFSLWIGSLRGLLNIRTTHEVVRQS